MASTAAGQPICGSCGTTFPQRWHDGRIIVVGIGFPLEPPERSEYSPADYEQAAREEGWRIGRGKTMGGQHYDDALCPVCARPDPATVALCRDLERSIDRNQGRTNQ